MSGTKVLPNVLRSWAGWSSFIGLRPGCSGLPPGRNIPDYPRLAQLWWQNIGDASSGAKSPQEAMTALAVAQERLLQRLERAGVLGECGPRLNEPQSREYWFNQPGAPKPALANEKPAPITVDYDELVKSWQ